MTTHNISHNVGEQPQWDVISWKNLIHPNTSALLVIDPQNDILKENGNMSYYGVWRRAEFSLSAIQSCVRSARRYNMPVFWIRYSRRADGKDLVKGVLGSARTVELRRRIPDTYKADSWDIEIVDELKEIMKPEDFFLDKSASGCLEGNDLERSLRQLGVRELFICVYLTDFCIANTARSAYDKGYGTILISDACDTRDGGYHEETLEQHRWYFGPVIDSSEFDALF